MSNFSAYPNSATPPVLPPKTGSQGDGRTGTPLAEHGEGRHGKPSSAVGGHPEEVGAAPPPPPQIPDPGEHWLPQILENKSKQDLADALASPSILAALTHSPKTIHPSLAASHKHLEQNLAANMALAKHVSEQATRLSHARSDTQAQLLATHALERQWRQKQTEMDHALAPFSPANLYQQLGQSLNEQAGVCQAMEESFLEEDGTAAEREVADWVRKYREAKSLYYLREERKGRWDEGRVGGWR